MLDFKELPKDGRDFELLIREILFAKGYQVYWSGVGPDGGRDLLCVERRESFLSPDKTTWLVQCKHNANSEKSVSVSDLDGIVDSCVQHGASGYILACSTQPSSAVVERLEQITKNPKNDITAIYWDYVFIERILSSPSLWRIAQRFFPMSASAESWQIYATERPNHWVVNYRGYYFHLNNRIGSSSKMHFDSLASRIDDIEAIKLPEHHFIRPRSVYYDDKNCGYTWYIDYMYPRGTSPELSTAEIKHILGDGYALDDGQFYSFEVLLRSYSSSSDHYDKDHYDYYTPYLNSFSRGEERRGEWKDQEESYRSLDELKDRLDRIRNGPFCELVSLFEGLDCLRLVRSVNAQVEDIGRFYLRRNWADLIESLGLETDRFFSAWLLFEVLDEETFLELITYIPQRVEHNFRLTRAFVYLPEDDGRSRLCSHEDDKLYELTLSIHPACFHDMETARNNLNEYFGKVADGVRKFVAARS